ncbi:HD domain-containing phosphohydrolase [Thiomonas sp. FB-Cd]|uniref:response regulator n=1 Tax=Thiomonas sp. FB-Cd TaxID=1158292 RepID=UPI00056F77C9|nr:HD domain-containing phosphohydrolase [Thiomonas sp. FB-Cd]
MHPTAIDQGWVREPVIIIVDDQSTNCHLLAEIAHGFCPDGKILSFDDPLAAVAYANAHQVDLVLTDYRMPQMNGVALIRTLRTMKHLNEPPIICVTAIDDLKVRYEALDAGANDYLSRPLDYRECAARCRNLLNMRRFQLATLHHAKELENRVEQVVQDLQKKKMETLFRLAKVAEQRDTDTGGHLNRIGRYSRLLARKMGCEESFATMMELAAPLHDIGKVAIPDNILLAERVLTPDEWAVMKTHTIIGHAMLSGGDSEDLMIAAEIARFHHEKFDGSGYPDGLSGQGIPISARILAVVDVYDALTSKRPYKKAWPNEEAIAYLRAQAGKHLDPELVNIFLSCRPDIDKIRVHLQ